MPKKSPQQQEKSTTKTSSSMPEKIIVDFDSAEDRKTLSQKILKTRKLRKISKKIAARRLHTSVETINKFEQNSWEVDAYSTALIKSYPKVLGIDEEVKISTDGSTLTRDTAFKNKNKFVSLATLTASNFVISVIFSLIIISVIGYIAFQVYLFTQPPKITINYPSKNMITSKNEITVSGSIANDSDLTINGFPVRADESGRFEHKIILEEGLNELDFTATNYQGRKTSISKSIIVR